MNNIEIIDNFLEHDYFQPLYEYVMGDNFDWYYSQATYPKISKSPLNYQFYHCIFRENLGVTGNSYNYTVPLLNKLNIQFLLKCKCNLNPQTESNTQIGDFHADYDFEHSKTAIFYVNTNNGFTLFEDGTKVDSVANRLVVFDTPKKHVGYSCTDKELRVVLNINYIPFNHGK